MGLPFTNLLASCCTSTNCCIRRQVCYPSYGPWPHVPPHVLVVILWALVLCCASRQVSWQVHTMQQLGQCQVEQLHIKERYACLCLMHTCKKSNTGHT